MSETSTNARVRSAPGAQPGVHDPPLAEPLAEGAAAEARAAATRELAALHDVDLDIEPGEAFGIVGANGSGKSTLLKLIAGIFAPSSGRLSVGGRSAR